jgi:glucose-1-phosphate cytidylyltransferase
MSFDAIADVPVVLLAGGLGTRLAEETEVRPKPMVEVGGQPILWHIMKNFGHHGSRQFYVALGYKGDVIKRYFRDFQLLSGSIALNLKTNELSRLGSAEAEDWRVHLIETGAETNTGGRVLRLRPHLSNTFILTYGDGVADVDIPALLAFHRSHGKLATLTAVRPPARFGMMVFDGSRVERFSEKPQGGDGWINGGFMVLEPGVFDFLGSGDSTSFEAEGLTRLAAAGELMAFKHEGFWQCMDTLRDKLYLQDLWGKDQAAWKVWR